MDILKSSLLLSAVVPPDRKSLSSLVGVLAIDMLSELTNEDPSLPLMKRALINKDYEFFCRIDAYLKSFWQCSAVVDGCVVVDNRIAIPNCFQNPFLLDFTDHITRGTTCYGGRRTI